MSLTINIYYTGKKGNAKKFAKEMVASGLVDRIRAEDCPMNPLHDKRKSIEDLVEYK